MGGYVTRYIGDFDTLTIRGSGHMVPEYKPRYGRMLLQNSLTYVLDDRASLEFLTRWLRKEDWKPYSP